MSKKVLVKVAAELNVGKDTIVEYLSDKGFEIYNKPNQIVTEEMYDELVRKFGKDKATKVKADALIFKNPLVLSKETLNKKSEEEENKKKSEPELKGLKSQGKANLNREEKSKNPNIDKKLNNSYTKKVRQRNRLKKKPPVPSSISEGNKSAEKNKDRRPRVFIGSSSEGLDIAEAIQENLDKLCEVTPWNQGFFGPGSGTLQTLVAECGNFDFAILVMTPDDLTYSRGNQRNSPRDNVLFELGLFMGKIGMNRTFVLFDRVAELKIPSDLAGVTLLDYQIHSDGNIPASVGAACSKIKRRVKKIGILEKS